MLRVGLMGCNVSNFVLEVLKDTSQALPLLSYERSEEISAVRHWSSRYPDAHPYTVVSPVYIFARDLRMFLDRSLWRNRKRMGPTVDPHGTISLHIGFIAQEFVFVEMFQFFLISKCLLMSLRKLMGLRYVLLYSTLDLI